MAITETQSTTGRFGNGSVNNVPIGITGWDCTIEKVFADSTDSNNYDSVTGQTWGSQQPGVVRATATIKGNLDLTGNVDANIIQKFKTDGPYAMALNVTQTTKFISGNWDFSNVKVALEIGEAVMVTFSADAKSNGIPTIY